jgi:hypothetical protein
MLAKHVEAKVFQHLEIILHGLTIGRCIKAVRPVTLIESTKLEHELAV